MKSLVEVDKSVIWYSVIVRRVKCDVVRRVDCDVVKRCRVM